MARMVKKSWKARIMTEMGTSLVNVSYVVPAPASLTNPWWDWNRAALYAEHFEKRADQIV